MEFPESHPRLVSALAVGLETERPNRNRNASESKRERCRRPSNTSLARYFAAFRFFPYAIPLPCGGGLGRGVVRFGNSVATSRDPHPRPLPTTSRACPTCALLMRNPGKP